jgi:hypothetical protein
MDNEPWYSSALKNSSETPPPDSDESLVLQGRGIEVAATKGWDVMRSLLNTTTWETLATNQITQIQHLREQAKGEPPIPGKSNWYIKDGETNYIRDSKQKYPDDGSQPFTVRDSSNKLNIFGRNLPQYGVNKLTRIYFSVPQSSIITAFDTLRDTLTENGAINSIQLALNRESLQTDNQDSVQDNDIILYIPDSNIDTLTLCSQAILKAKQKNTQAFQPPTSQLATVKADAAATFKVPLDDSTWFVEMEPIEGGRSYDTSTVVNFRKMIYRGYHSQIDGLPNLTTYKESVAHYGAENGVPAQDKGLSYRISKRQLKMPGLVSE